MTKSVVKLDPVIFFFLKSVSAAMLKETGGVFLHAKQKVWISVYCGGVWMNLKAPTPSIIQSACLPPSASSATWPAERRGVGRFARRLLTAAVHNKSLIPGFSVCGG